MTGPIIPADQWPDEFKGDNAKLIGCINALLSMDAAGALVPHGIGGHARILLSASAHRLAPAAAIDLEQLRKSVDAAWACGAIELAEAKRLLALIDGQAKPFVCTGDVLRCFDGNGCECRMRGLEPTKGEGQAAPRPLIARQLAEWHEDDGPAMWWAWCGSDWAGEPAWCGTPNDCDWPGYHTHWTPHPAMPMQPTKGEGE